MKDEDKTYENEIKHSIGMLTKQKEYMQKKCREAGGAILDLELQVQTLKKDIDRLAEENSNLRIKKSSPVISLRFGTYRCGSAKRSGGAILVLA